MKQFISYISILLVLFTLTNCNTSILTTDVKELSVTNIPNKNYKITVFYLPSNATVQSAIQVRKKFVDYEEVIATYERYNSMDTCGLINDNTFMLVLRDTISILGNKPDTLQIVLK